MNLLQFKLLSKQYKNTNQADYIVSAYDFFATKQAQYPHDFAQAGFYTALYYRYKGMDKLYINHLESTLSHCLKHKEDEIAAKICYHIGSFYHKSNKYPLAIKAYKQALDMYTKQYNYAWQIHSLTAIGNMFLEQHKNDSALEYYNTAYRLAQSRNDSSMYAGVLQNIGLAYREKGDSYTSIAYYKKALQWPQTPQNRARTHVNIATFYLKKNQFDSVAHYLQKAKPIVVSNKHDLYLLNNYHRAWTHLYIKQGHKQEALDAFTRFGLYFDTIVQENNKKMAEAIRLEQEKHTLANSKTHKNEWDVYWLIGVLGTLLFLFILWYFIRIKSEYKNTLTHKNNTLNKHTFLLDIYQREMSLNKLSLEFLEAEKIKSLKSANSDTNARIESYIKQLRTKYKEENNRIENTTQNYLQANGFEIDTALLSHSEILYIALCHANVNVEDIIFLTRSSSIRALQTRTHRIKTKLQEAHIPDNIIEKWINTCLISNEQTHDEKKPYNHPPIK